MELSSGLNISKEEMASWITEESIIEDFCEFGIIEKEWLEKETDLNFVEIIIQNDKQIQRSSNEVYMVKKQSNCAKKEIPNIISKLEGVVQEEKTSTIQEYSIKNKDNKDKGALAA